MQNGREIVDNLESIARLLTLSGKDAFKARAYERGAAAVAALGDELGAVIAEGRLAQVDGIGPSLTKQILALWTTGESPLLQSLSAAYPPGATELSRIASLTLRRMEALHNELGIRSIAELEAACAANRVQRVAGFGVKVEGRIAADIGALKAAACAQKRVLLHDGLALADSLGAALCEAGVASAVHVTGDARRAEETLSELALLVVSEDEGAVFDTLSRHPEVGAIDRAARTAQLTRGITLAVHLTDAADVPRALIASTGSASHVRLLADLAQACPVSRELNASAGATAALPPADEAAVYRALGRHWVPPELRVGGTELTDAATDDFSDLLTVADVRGMVHCHTTHSDGKDTVEAMARAAWALGMEYITITDHSPAAHYARGVNVDGLRRLWDEIAEVQTRVPIRILRGTESDILADGSLDYPDAILEQLDVVIASIHTRNKMDSAAMTARLSRALSLPVFKIWGHALGRLLLSRAPIDCDLPRVLDALAASRGAVEISCDPHRLDLPPAFIPLARERGLPFVISVDAHSVAGLGTLALGVKMARRGGVRKREVLNALGADAFAQRVRPASA